MEESKRLTGASHSLALISGPFVQRGEPSLIDKWSKAELAIQAGLDLVLELPFIYASSSAEFFAHGAVKILDSLKVVDFLSFGAEDNMDLLKLLGQTLSKEPEDFKNILRSKLNSSIPFAQAREEALVEFLNLSSGQAISKPNNILAIEYLKALYKLESSIEALAIRRLGNDYNSLETSGDFLSASAIRKAILNKNLETIRSGLPDYSYQLLKSYSSFNSLKLYQDIIIYKLRFSKIQATSDADKSLLNRIIKNSQDCSNLEDLINRSVSKIHTRARVKRCLIQILNDLYLEEFRSLVYKNNYIRVLAANEKGLELLARIKKESSVSTINKFAHSHRLESPDSLKILDFDKKANDIFFLKSPKKNYNMDYLISPLIKKGR